MKVINLLELGAKMLEMMSVNDIRLGDEKFVRMFRKYEQMRHEGEKYSVCLMVLSEKYGVSESSVSRVVRRLSRDVRL
jgi:Mor family transcriptional regulator